MAYNPAGASVGLNKNFNRNQNQSQNSLDELVIIESYDIAKNIMYARRDDEENPRQFEITIKKAEVLRAEQSLTDRGVRADSYGWMGHSIDDKMKKKFPAGSKVILTRATQVAMNKESGRAVLEAHRVNSVNVPEKTFRGILTVSYRVKDGLERVSRIQHWKKNAINVNSKSAIEVLIKEIDAAAAFYGEKIGEHNVTKPSMGFQFRTLLKTDKEYEFAKNPNAKAIWEAVDFSVPFDWIRNEGGGAGEKASGHLVNGEELQTYLEGYVNYIRNHEAFSAEFDRLKIEVCPFDVFLASAQDNMQLTFNSELDVNKDKNPLYQLSHRKSYIDMEQTEMLEGRNAAVNGILQLTADRIVKIDGKIQEIPNNWAVRLHANNYRGHVHAFIRTEEDEKVVVHPNLGFPKRDDAQEMKSNHVAGKSKQEDKPKEEPVENFGDFDGGGDMFGDNGFLNTNNENLFGNGN